ncbi:MAG: polysaccharide deacetylase [Clostridiaceae bacterium]|nr:polysaccharide deacetylase [Clostridiaceae bacterium]
MKHYLKTSVFILLLVIMSFGLVGCGASLTSETTAVADEFNTGLEEETTQENISIEELPKFPQENLKEEEPIEEPKEEVKEEPVDEAFQEEKPIGVDENVRVAYLTFDDGPSPNITPQVLDILKEYDIKATFFVIGNMAEKNPDILLRIQKEGHLIGNHTYTHDYKHIYSHPQKLVDELKKTDELLLSILGNEYGKPRFMRFPGGSFGDKLLPFRQAVKEAGYISIDWNVVNGDAEAPSVPAEKQFKRLQETLQNKRQAVILMHDSNGKQTTVDALPALIEYIMSQGYVFKTLEPGLLQN